MKTLLVIIPYRLSEILSKGEVVDDYFNQGGQFDSVHFISLANDHLSHRDHALMQKTVGSAEWSTHFSSRFRMILTMFNLRWLTRWAVSPLYKKALSLKPDLIRCYGNQSEGFLGVLLQKKLKISLILSIHNTPEFEKRNALKWMKNPFKRCFWRILFWLQTRMEAWVNARADEIITVYKPAYQAIRANGGQNVHVIYNILNKSILPKKEFSTSSPFRLVSVGNQNHGVKDPTVFLKALKGRDVHLDLIGNGNLHEDLKRLAKKEGIQDQINFIPSLPNETIVQKLHDYDAYIFHTYAPEFSKSIIEAMLAQLPILHNQRDTGYSNDFPDEAVHLVPDTSEGYGQGIDMLMKDEAYRTSLAKAGYSFAKEQLNPDKMEHAIVSLYQKHLPK